MKIQASIMVMAMILAVSCTNQAPQPAENAKPVKLSSIDDATKSAVAKSLKEKYGEQHAFRIEKGVQQAASFWQNNDGSVDEFKTFCSQNFISTDEELDLVFNHLSAALESLYGCMNKINIDLKIPLDLDKGDIHPLDEILGSYSPYAHFTDDMFSNKLAFIVLLNFPFYSLDEKTVQGMNWTRKQWAYARMGELFTSRVPAALNQEIANVQTESGGYISEYNIFMGNLQDDSGNKPFPKDLRLITHWGIRDELKSQYNSPDGLEKQKMIYQVMLRIIRQDIPGEVINNGDLIWNPYSNKVWKDGGEITAAAEPDARYMHLLNNFKALKAADPYNPFYPTYISRAFDQDMEIPQADVEALFTALISAPEVKQVGEIISKRLGRPLEPFDIWYDGFKSRSGISQETLDQATRQKYPTPEALKKDLPNILMKLGFNNDSANILASRIVVDPARGSGHAWGAEMRGDYARLRSRVGPNGMDYKGYNIAVHEFGHNVEQTISLYNMDYYILHGVPNTGFTEALAFMFQKRDLELLGMEKQNPEAEYLNAMDNLWSNYEIMGVSLVDMRVWKWLYEHPDDTPAQLKEAVINIATEVWNSYFAPVIGVKDSPILAIYSHMIDNPLYLSAYPVGHLIQFQVEQYMKGKELAQEVYRMFSLGTLVPQVWMKEAVGNVISVKPALDATDEALKMVK